MAETFPRKQLINKTVNIRFQIKNETKKQIQLKLQHPSTINTYQASYKQTYQLITIYFAFS